MGTRMGFAFVQLLLEWHPFPIGGRSVSPHQGVGLMLSRRLG
jgi:hypothetical protein